MSRRRVQSEPVGPKRIGFVGWAVPSGHYPLPDGLERNTRVRVIAEVHGTVDLRVVTDDGREFTLPHPCIDHSHYRTSGPWLDESDPRVLDYLATEYRSLAAERWPDGVEADRAQVLRNLADKLTRHGREVPDVQTGCAEE